jgi:hypothetical protein
VNTYLAEILIPTGTPQGMHRSRRENVRLVAPSYLAARAAVREAAPFRTVIVTVTEVASDHECQGAHCHCRY